MKAEGGKRKAEMKNSPHFLGIVMRIADERRRQRQLLITGKISFNCSSPVVDDTRKACVLYEEVGEVAQAVLEWQEKPCAIRREHLRMELVQVAAVAVAWLESLEGK